MSDTQLAPGIFHQLVRNVTEDVLAVNVGTSIAISHSAPTFFGGAVSVKATLTAVGAGGRSFTFAVEARDNAGLVAQGTHERFAVDKAKFESKAEERLAM